MTTGNGKPRIMAAKPQRRFPNLLTVFCNIVEFLIVWRIVNAVTCFAGRFGKRNCKQDAKFLTAPEKMGPAELL